VLEHYFDTDLNISTRSRLVKSTTKCIDPKVIKVPHVQEVMDAQEGLDPNISHLKIISDIRL